MHYQFVILEPSMFLFALHTLKNPRCELAAQITDTHNNKYLNTWLRYWMPGSSCFKHTQILLWPISWSILSTMDMLEIASQNQVYPILYFRIKHETSTQYVTQVTAFGTYCNAGSQFTEFSMNSFRRHNYYNIMWKILCNTL